MSKDHLASSSRFEIRLCEGDRRIGGVIAGLGQHPGGNVDPQHRCRPRLPCPATEPAVATAQVDDPQPGDVADQRAQCGPLGGAIEAPDRALQASIAREEVRIVIDVLGHLKSAMQRRSAGVRPRSRPGIPRGDSGRTAGHGPRPAAHALATSPARRNACASGRARPTAPAAGTRSVGRGPPRRAPGRCVAAAR